MTKRLSTKELLAESLLELSKAKPVDKITVSDIAKNCGVSRKTFYNAFLDKYDLIEWMHFSNCKKIADTYIGSNPVVSCTKMFAYICENIAFYKNLARKRSEDIHQILYRVSYNVMLEYFLKESNREQLSEEDAFQLSCYTHGSVTKIIEWLNCPNRMTVETIGRYITLAWPVGLAKYLHIQNNDITGDIIFHIREPDQSN